MGSKQQGEMETKKRQLHLKLKASNLPSGDAMSKSDPFLVIFQVILSPVSFENVKNRRGTRVGLSTTWRGLK